jgi:DNA-binding response OmpR family regulator
MKILLVEDDDRIADAVVEYLTDQHYVVEVADNGKIAQELLDVFAYELILLDIMLPEIDGITLCRQLRFQGYDLPILMLTARDTIPDRVMGLDAGADDYLIKPFALQELSARIRALLRRGKIDLPPVLSWGELRLDPNTYEVFYQNTLLNLRPKEFRVLEFFLRHEGRVISRGELLAHLWADDAFPEEATVKMHIRNLRQKLSAVKAPDPIETVYGLGYRLRKQPEAALS